MNIKHFKKFIFTSCHKFFLEIVQDVKCCGHLCSILRSNQIYSFIYIHTHIYVKNNAASKIMKYSIITMYFSSNQMESRAPKHINA